MAFELNRKGGEEVLKQMAAPHIAKLTAEVVAAAGDDAVSDLHVTDRAAGSVSVPAEQQAKDGVLTRAAAAVGLEVHRK